MTVLMCCGMLFGCATKDVSGAYSEAEKEEFSAAGKEKLKSGMIVAIGGGFDEEEDFKPLIDRCLSHVNKDKPKMLFIPTAHKDELDDPEEIVEWFSRAGCETDILLVSKATEAEAAEKVAWADIIYETGGSLKFLTEHWSKKGMYGAVKKAYDRGAALIGTSSGAMCWAERGWDDCGEKVFRVIDSFPFLGKDASYDFYDCAGILPFCICPHFDNVAWKTYAKEAKKLDIPSLCIENGAAVVCEGGAYEVISDNKTPRRTAYLYYPDRRIIKFDVKKDAEVLTLIAGERLDK